jgi:hypothetical protein
MNRYLHELWIFLIIFVLLSLIVHFQAWLDHPIEHIGNLFSNSPGKWHPFLLSFMFYAVVVILRSGVYFFRKILSK